MRIRREDKILTKSKETEELVPAKIDLSAISRIINSLNNIMAPVISNDINDIKDKLDKKNEDSKSKLMEVKDLNNKLTELRVEKQKVLKRIKIVSILGEMFSTCAINDKLRKEMVLMMKELNNYSDKKLDLQISKLERLIGR